MTDDFTSAALDIDNADSQKAGIRAGGFGNYLAHLGGVRR